MLIANIIAITLLLVFAIALIVKREKHLPDNYLLLIILFFISYLASYVWVNYSMSRLSFALHIISGFYTFPPLFFYAMLLITAQRKVKRSWWKFISLHIVYGLFVIADVFILNDYSVADLQRIFVNPPLSYHIFYKGLQVYTLVIMIWFLTKLKKYQLKIENYYSNIEGLRLTWLEYFFWIYILLFSISLLTVLSFNLGLIANIDTFYFVTNSSIAFSLFWLIYKGLKQYSLANFADKKDDGSDKVEKYNTSSLSDVAADDLYQMIKELFEQDKIFHNPELKVQDIAKRLGVTNHNISQVLNQKAETNFYEFVNDYRISHFKQLLADNNKKRYTILALGLESGFNSKASINRVFKQRVGKTPKEYQQSVFVG